MGAPTETGYYPEVTNISVHFVWMSVAEILRDHEPNDGYSGTWDVLEDKQNAPGYPRLVESLADKGFYDPVYLEPREKRFINGHHRIAAALDLGYIHVPVTFSSFDGYDDSGPVHSLSSDS